MKLETRTIRLGVPGRPEALMVCIFKLRLWQPHGSADWNDCTDVHFMEKDVEFSFVECGQGYLLGFVRG